MVIELNRELALKLATFKEKVENGGNMLLVDGTVRGEIMALILTWLMLHQDDHIDATSSLSSGRLTSFTEKDKCFLHLTVLQGGTVLVELARTRCD